MKPSNLQEPSLPPIEPEPGPRGRLKSMRASLSLPIAIVALAGATIALVVALGRPLLGADPAPTSEPFASPVPTATMTPAPSPTPTLPPGVRRVLVARFGGSDSSFEVAQSVEGALLAALASEGLNGTVQVARLGDEITSHEEARALLEREGADLIIWGRVEADSVRARTTLRERGLPDVQRVHGAPATSSIVFPPELEFYLSRDLGTNMTFLSLATIGQLSLADGDLEAARGHFQSALLAMPAALPREARERGVGIVQFYYGLIALEGGDTLEALQSYSQTARLYGDLTSTYNNRGSVYSALGDYEMAFSEYETVLASEPENVLALENRSLTRLAMGDEDGALLDAERLLTLAPDDPRSANLRGLLLYWREDYAGALEDFERAVALAPASASAQFNVGATLDALGRGAEAIAAYDVLLERYPDDVLALVYRGNAYLGRGLDAQAVTDYDEALKRDLALVYGYQQRAAFYLERGNDSVALVDLETALNIDPEDARTHLLLGHVYAAQGDLPAAENAYDAALELAPENVEALSGRGGVRRASRLFVGAREDLQRALELGGPTPELQFDLGFVYYELGQYEEAAGALKYVVANRPGEAEAYAGLALALDAQIRRDEADETLRRALELDPRMGDLDYLRDELNWSLQARNRLETILRRLEG
jgi:tetratricopeptide (TPR) repeat protein